MGSIQRLKARSVPNCNRDFIAKSVNEDKRIDGRGMRDFRELNIGFGLEYGSCIVSLGATKVMCNISYQVVEPKIAKPCEGILNIRLDLSAMMVHNREESVEISRLIEKNIRDSKCLDMESLCILAGDKVIQLDADLIALNEDGNVTECCSIALLASLSHYRRPDITIKDGEMIIHSFDEHHPIPLHILHSPYCTSFSFFENSKFVIDPVQAEEQVCDSHLTVGANLYREITVIHISGKSMIHKDTVLRCCDLAIERSKFLTKFVREAIQADLDKRKDGKSELGYVPLIRSESYVLCGYRKEAAKLTDMEEPAVEEKIDKDFELAAQTKMYRYAADTIGVGEGGPNKWSFIDDFNAIEEKMEGDEVEDQKKIVNGKTSTVSKGSNVKNDHKVHQIDPGPEEILVEDSDEDVQILEPSEFK
ncbi:uncharacterized protein LOC141849182 [Brevipalpus obovatus]|uniref:uncharacterized protein LOC141849182 n=1 Tax=Brevipalpus obovatus TaxID=246614 RepID=UPI003D9DBDC9